MAADLRLVRITRHQVAYVWATPREIERAVTGWTDPSSPDGRTVDGDALLALNARIPDRDVVDSHVTAEVVEPTEDGLSGVGIEDWHIVPHRPWVVRS